MSNVAGPTASMRARPREASYPDCGSGHEGTGEKQSGAGFGSAGGLERIGIVGARLTGGGEVRYGIASSGGAGHACPREGMREVFGGRDGAAGRRGITGRDRAREP